MEALRNWGWTNLALSVLTVLYGFFSGAFEKKGGIRIFPEKMAMVLIVALVFLLIAVTVCLVIHAIRDKSSY